MSGGGKNPAAKMKNHQWRRTDPLDDLWFSRVGHRGIDGLYERFGMLGPQALHPEDHTSPQAMGAMGGSVLLEARVHALVGAMAAFTSAPQGPAAHAVHFGSTIATLMAADSRP